jgi:spore coat polysaccharide biosynthesis protein SpsF
VETEQSKFWEGQFGGDYIGRNQSPELLASNLYLFGQVLSRCSLKPTSFLELGANIGMNYAALSLLIPKCAFYGVEVNALAFDALLARGARGENSSIEAFSSDEKFDFCFTKGVLIHLNPESLAGTYKKLGSASKRYVMICEYFNPSPVAIEYRGNVGKLFKRDFGAEFLEANPDFLQISDGFSSSRATFPQDNLTWQLFERVKE